MQIPNPYCQYTIKQDLNLFHSHAASTYELHKLKLTNLGEKFSKEMSNVCVKSIERLNMITHLNGASKFLKHTNAPEALDWFITLSVVHMKYCKHLFTCMS